MRAWDQLVEQYLKDYQRRRCCEGSVRRVQSVLSQRPSAAATITPAVLIVADHPAKQEEAAA